VFCKNTRKEHGCSVVLLLGRTPLVWNRERRG
jgi:hypothetical protein